MKDFRPIRYELIQDYCQNPGGKVLPKHYFQLPTGLCSWKALDQVLFANEAIEDNRQRNDEGVIFKVDFKKPSIMWIGID